MHNHKHSKKITCYVGCTQT